MTKKKQTERNNGMAERWSKEHVREEGRKKGRRGQREAARTQ